WCQTRRPRRRGCGCGSPPSRLVRSPYVALSASVAGPRPALVLICPCRLCLFHFSSRRKSMLAKISSAILLAMCVATATLLDEAGGQPPLQVPSREPGIQSVLIKLEEDKDAFERYVAEQLSPQMSKIIITFEQNVARAGELLEQLRTDPNNKQLRAQY